MRRAAKPSQATPTLTSPVPNPRTPKKQRPSASATAAPDAPAGLPVIMVERVPVCHWARCSKPAEVRIGFAPPSLLSSEPDRPYCLLPAGKVGRHQGAVILGRLHLPQHKRGRKPA